MSFPAFLRSRPGWVGFAVAVAAGLSVSSLQAQTNETVAESLYQDAKLLIERGQYVRACPKLAESHRMDPAGGTVLLLAVCYEQVGKTASAWVKYNEAIAMARRDGRLDREQRARERVEALEPTLSYLELLPSPELARTARVEVTLDGTRVPLESVAALPVDPGPHTVTAWAPGKQRWSQTISVSDTEQERVRIPPLSDLPGPPRPPRAALRHAAPPVRAALVEAPTSRTRVAAWVVGAAGVASLGASGYFGWRASTLHEKAQELCPADECDDRVGVQKNEDAQWAARGADALGVLGILALGTAVTLYLSSGGSERAPSAALVIAPNEDGATLSARTRF